MNTPPPLPHGDPHKPARRTLLIVLACIGGLVVLSVPIALAILVPAVGKVRESARRTVDGSSVRQVVQASLIWASGHDGQLPPVGLASNGVASPTEPATIQAVAAALARDGGLNVAFVWFSAAERQRNPGQLEPTSLIPVLGPDRNTLDPAFGAQTKFAWDYATGLSFTLPPSTPIAWTRGLREDGRWDPNTSVYGGDGGFVAFLGGNVVFLENLGSSPLQRPDGGPTTNILEALPDTARVVGAGPGTLHGRTGRASGK